MSDESTDAYAIVVPQHDHVVVAFRGTDSAVDVAHNLMVFRVHAGGVACRWGFCMCPKVHQGFHTQYHALRPALLRALQRERDEEGQKRVVFTGHSMGGALATLAAHDLCDTHSVACVTFGAPRVGNWSFARTFRGWGERMRRVVHRSDLIPSLPPVWWGYAHPSGASATTVLRGGTPFLFAHDIDTYINYLQGAQ